MLLLILSSLCGVIITTYLYKYYMNLRRERALTAKLPDWSVHIPLLGNALMFLGDTKSFVTRMTNSVKLYDSHGGRFRVWLGPQFLFITHNPEDIKIITNTFIEKPYYYKFAQVWVGNGLVTAPGEIWKRNIKTLAGTFTGSIVDGFQSVFNVKAEKLMNQLRGEADRPPFDALDKYLTYATLETICQTALEVTNISSFTEYYEAFNKTTKLLIARGLNLFLHPEFIYRLTPDYWKLKRYVKILHDMTNSVIANKRKEWNQIKCKEDQQPNGVGKPKFKSFLDTLMALSESDPDLTDDQIRAEVSTIIAGGQETNATSLSFIFLLLGSNPRVQDKLYAEIKEIFGDSDRPVEKEDLSKMLYCEAVINETLRLYPPIPVVLRCADKDLAMDGFTIPSGTVIVIGIWGAGHSQKLWGKDVEEFRPERWLNTDPPSPATFTPFSYGRRSCIGRKYAIALLKTILCWCVRELEIKSDISKLSLKFDITLRAAEGNLIEVRLRKPKPTQSTTVF